MNYQKHHLKNVALLETNIILYVNTNWKQTNKQTNKCCTHLCFPSPSWAWYKTYWYFCLAEGHMSQLHWNVHWVGNLTLPARIQDYREPLFMMVLLASATPLKTVTVSRGRGLWRLGCLAFWSWAFLIQCLGDHFFQIWLLGYMYGLSKYITIITTTVTVTTNHYWMASMVWNHLYFLHLLSALECNWPFIFGRQLHLLSHMR